MRTRIIAICALIASTASPASAQVTGSRLSGHSGAMVASVGEPDASEIGPLPTDEAVRVARAFTKCLVTSRRKDVVRFMASTTDEDQKANLARFSSSMPECLGEAGPGATEIRIDGAFFQGALAEALLGRQALGPLPRIEPSKTVVPHWLSDRADQRIVEEMAICLSDRNPQESVALVQTAPGSSAEAAAFGALSPLMGPCLISGTTLHANLFGIRFALADAVYHRVTAADSAAAVSTGGSR